MRPKIIIAAVAVVIIAAAFSVWQIRASNVSVRGSVTVFAADDFDYLVVLEAGKRCSGPPGSGIVAGTNVIVKDDDGKTLGLGHLGAGKAKEIDREMGCQFPFKFDAERPDTGFFTIKLGDDGEGVTFKSDRIGEKLELAV